MQSVGCSVENIEARKSKSRPESATSKVRPSSQASQTYSQTPTQSEALHRPSTHHAFTSSQNGYNQGIENTFGAPFRPGSSTARVAEPNVERTSTGRIPSSHLRPASSVSSSFQSVESIPTHPNSGSQHVSGMVGTQTFPSVSAIEAQSYANVNSQYTGTSANFSRPLSQQQQQMPPPSRGRLDSFTRRQLPASQSQEIPMSFTACQGRREDVPRHGMFSQSQPQENELRETGFVPQTSYNSHKGGVAMQEQSLRPITAPPQAVMRHWTQPPPTSVTSHDPPAHSSQNEMDPMYGSQEIQERQQAHVHRSPPCSILRPTSSVRPPSAAQSSFGASARPTSSRSVLDLSPLPQPRFGLPTPTTSKAGEVASQSPDKENLPSTQTETALPPQSTQDSSPRRTWEEKGKQRTGARQSAPVYTNVATTGTQTSQDRPQALRANPTTTATQTSQDVPQTLPEPERNLSAQNRDTGMTTEPPALPSSDSISQNGLAGYAAKPMAQRREKLDQLLISFIDNDDFLALCEDVEASLVPHSLDR